jgi:hypothetical protein
MNRKAIKLSQAVRRALSLGCLLTLLVPSSAVRSAVAETVTSNWMIPFQGTVYVNNGGQSEVVDLAGSIHLVVKVSIPVDPCASCVPPNPTRIHTNLVSISGVGQTSGMRYEANGAANLELEVDVPSAFTFEASYRLKSIPSSVSASLPVQYSVTLNSAGEVTAASAGAGGSVDAEMN